MSRIRSIVSIAALVGGTALVGACSQGNVFALEVGDCFNDQSDSTSGEVSNVPVVDCSEAHDKEVFHDFELPDGDLPSSDDIYAAVETECLPAFETYLGVDYFEQMDYEVTWFEPTQDSWDKQGDHLVTCVVYALDGQTTGSLEGALG